MMFLMPTLLGDTDPAICLPAGYLEKIQHLRAFFVEEKRTARRFLRKIGYKADFDEVVFVELNEHTRAESLEEVLREAGVSEAELLGQDVGVMSEAGLPCVADPGALAVEWAHRKGVRVVPLCGPSSVFMALMASGFNGQNFCFHGYLPVEPDARMTRLKELEGAARRGVGASGSGSQTQIFIETPYRSGAMFEAILKACRPDTKLCVACQITCEDEYIKTLSVARWREACKNGCVQDINKKNTVFLMA